MNIVLVGGSGFLGQYVVPALARQGHVCTVLTRNAERRKEFRLVPGVRLVETDVHSPDALEAAFADSNAVFSMAGILNERGFDGSGFRRVHVELVEHIRDAMNTLGIRRLLHVSAMNAGRGDSHYLRTKGEAEELLGASGLEVSIFRPSVMFGPGDAFFNRFHGLLRLSPVLPLACPDSKLQPVYARDVARVMVLSLADPQTAGQVFELGGPRVYTLEELVRWIARIRHMKRCIVGLPDSLSRLQARVMDLVPGKPFSMDNYRSLQLPNVTAENALPKLGIQPASVEAVVPAYLGASPRQARLSEIRRLSRRD